jgi:cytochrome c-type biogenesis protein
VTLDQVSVPLAFAAGVVSFLSPCVLPMVPAYLAHLAGLAEPGGRRWGNTVINTAAFLVGLSLVFILCFYALRTVLGPYRVVIGPVAGVIVILMGLHTSGLLRLPLLDREFRLLKQPPGRAGAAGAMLLGIGFAAAWTPCIGATLGAVLSSGITSGSSAAGLILMAAYCLGLGVPFLAMGLGLERAVLAVRALRRRQRAINMVSGGVLVAMGVLLVTGNFLLLTQLLGRIIPASAPFGI